MGRLQIRTLIWIMKATGAGVRMKLQPAFPNGRPLRHLISSCFTSAITIFAQAQPLDSTVNEISAMIDILRTTNPSIIILLAQNIASMWPCHAQMSEFIAQLPRLSAAKSTEQSPISLVDQHTAFDPASMTWDGQHPNEKGESLMAQRWFATLRPLLDQRFSRSP
jgi:lysophospholipase L1-like esterase